MKNTQINKIILFTIGENPERCMPGKCAFTITICSSDDGIQLHIKEMHWQIQNCNIVRDDHPPNVYGCHQIVYRKQLETLVQVVRIYSLDIGMEFGKEKCAILIMICGKRKSKRIRRLGRKETCKY